MKVFYIVDSLNVGGAEKSLLEILGNFRHVQPVMCHIYCGSDLRPAYEKANIHVISLNIKKRLAFHHALRKLIQAIRHEAPDVIHLTGFYSTFLGRMAGFLLKVPIVESFSNETYTPRYYASLPTQFHWKLKIAQWLDRLTFRWVKHVISVSEAVRQANSGMLKLSPQKVSVIYRGRNPQPFLDVNPQAGEKLRRIYDITPETTVLLNVARLIYRKGHKELIEALSIIQHKYHDVRLFIAGDGHYRPELEAHLQKLGITDKVVFLGMRDDIPTWLHVADIFMFPSHYEGHPGAVIEAMFAACPIIASDIPVHHETLIHHETGYLAQLQSAQGLAMGIAWLLDNPNIAKQMGKKARSIAMQRFHIKTISAQYERFYIGLL